jgi:hypothetical protein
MGANPHANGGLLLRDLRLPDFHAHAVDVPAPGGARGRTRWSSGATCATLSGSTSQRATSGWSVPMRRSRTCSARCSK